MWEYKNKRTENITSFLDSYRSGEFKSPFRSTIPLVVLFKKNKFEIGFFLQENEVNEARYIFEHETPVKKGVGKPSCSDLLISTNDSSILIEAKRTEGYYEKVGSWVGNNKNRNDVLSGWIEYINDCTHSDFTKDHSMNFPYQMVHRIASACALKKKNTNVIYLGFDLNDRMVDYYKNNLNAIKHLLNGSVHMYLITYSLIKQKEQMRLESEWERGARNLSVNVKEGIIKDELMDFNDRKIEKICI